MGEAKGFGIIMAIILILVLFLIVGFILYPKIFAETVRLLSLGF